MYSSELQHHTKWKLIETGGRREAAAVQLERERAAAEQKLEYQPTLRGPGAHHELAPPSYSVSVLKNSAGGAEKAQSLTLQAYLTLIQVSSGYYI